MFKRNWMLFGLIGLSSLSLAQTLPQLPCGRGTWPAYPAVDQRPVIQYWEKADWQPPPCTGWQDPGAATLVVTAARFRFSGGRDGLLRRIGAISAMQGMRYWSVTHQEWRVLIVDASAVSDSSGEHRRADFSAMELAAGVPLFFRQQDSSFGAGVYKLHVMEASPDRIVFESTNVTPLRMLMLPVLPAGEIQWICFLDHESEDVWRYYSLARTRTPNPLFAGHAASAMNRAAAMYRRLAGVPADKDGLDAK